MARTADLVLAMDLYRGSRPAALAVSAGRITAMGDEGDVAALIGPCTRVVDALGIA
jgi:predicted amidohydrolase YtcJ